ncbi:MAG: heparan-alpha-glucosaminide N-acetyltransferase domain-containing protein [Bacteroidota bacterium]|nr:heparan-alpha-glucosaminide N-acetyltransferase domain-containing protein [Bacteroidota bacterium]
MPHSKQRYLFIDLLRFMAVFFMIQGHVFDALLSREVKSLSLYYIHDFFHGFIAPMFLFASGVAFGVSTFKKWEEHIVVSRHVWKRVGKFLGLIAIGYALHLPYFSLKKILEETTQKEFNAWLQVDALQCIAVTLLLLQMVILIVKDEKLFVRFLAVGAGLVIFLSPILWSMHLTTVLPLWIVSYINFENNSWFSLFPWSAYIFSGIIFASLFINAKEHRHAMALMQKNVAVSSAVIIVSIIAAMTPFSVYPAHDFWKVNPTVIFARIGAVSMVTSSVFFAEHSVKIRSRLPQLMGRESLFIYIIHLLIIYGSVMNNGLQFYFGPTLSVFQALGVFAVIFGVIISVTLMWNKIKLHYDRSAMAMRILLVGILFYEFITRPW